MTQLKIASIQASLFWEDTAKNLAHFDQILTGLEDVDVIILPEMFTTGFSMTPSKIARKNGGQGLSWMQEKAKQLNASLVGSIAVDAEGSFRNRLFWVFPDGNYKFYDKRHLFRMAGEQEVYEEGNERLIVDFRGFRICPLVCYDLRFPVWSRNGKTEENRYDLLIYVANWPAVRSDAWFTLLKARAIENVCYTVGVNRVGVDGNAIEYDGKSAVFDFKGARMDTHEDGKEGVSIQVVSKKDLEEFRTKFPAHLDADDFQIEL